MQARDLGHGHLIRGDGFNAMNQGIHMASLQHLQSLGNESHWANWDIDQRFSPFGTDRSGTLLQQKLGRRNSDTFLLAKNRRPAGTGVLKVPERDLSGKKIPAFKDSRLPEPSQTSPRGNMVNHAHQDVPVRFD